MRDSDWEDFEHMQESNIFSIASIHATILGTIIAALLISVSLLGDKRLSLLQHIIEAHHKVSQLVQSLADLRVPLSLLYDRENPEFHLEQDGVREKAMSLVFQAAMGPLGVLVYPSLDKYGEKVVEGLAALVTHYPFSTSIKDNSGAYYIQWLKDVKSSLVLVREVEEYHGELIHSVTAYQEVRRGQLKESSARRDEQTAKDKKEVEDIEKAIPGLREADPERIKLHLRRSKLLRDIREEASLNVDYVIIVERILQVLEQVRGKIEDVMPQYTLLKHYDEMLSASPGMVILVSMLMTFIFGVALPLTHNVHWQCGAFWCPYIFYVIIPIFGHIMTGTCVVLLITRILK